MACATSDKDVGTLWHLWIRLHVHNFMACATSDKNVGTHDLFHKLLEYTVP